MFSVMQLVTAAGCFLFSIMLTAYLRNYIIRRRILDVPNTRSSHIVPTPRGGGLAFVVVFCSAALILFYWETNISTVTFNVIFFGGLVVAAVGWLDDYFSLRPIIRISVHLIVALACLIYLGTPQIPFLDTTIPLAWAAYPLTAIALVWCLNFFNFMDGIDGIAAVQAMTMLIAGLIILAVSSPNTGVLSAGLSPYLLILLASVFGFLVWNWPPAKIFMGDTASGFLGFILALFAVITALDGSVNVWSWLILFGVFIVDSTVTLTVRFLRKEPWYQAHRQHAYQRFAMNLQMAEGVLLAPERARAYAHQAVIMAVAGINLVWLLPLALMATYQPAWGWMFAIIALIPLSVVGIKSQNLGGHRGDRW